MLAAIHSAALLGIDAVPVTVEVDAVFGLPQWTIVGLPASAVKESRERVHAALVNSGYTLPPRRTTVSLAPGDLKKEGTSYDLPIAIGLLVATGHIDPRYVAGCVFVGELGLDGQLRPIRGALSIARSLVQRFPDENARPILVFPPDNVNEVRRVSNLRVSTPRTLQDLVNALRAETLPLVEAQSLDVPSRALDTDVDFADVAGQAAAKRALEVAAAGGHNTLLIGPPGAGKTMLARRLPTIMPVLTDDEALEVIAIHSVAGTLTEHLVMGTRPFRAPHHSISGAGLIGGGGNPRPGEISLAHHGVLFLDEMPEFSRSVLNALRQPLEDLHVTIARATMSVSFPARFTLVAALNPCPCGYAGDGSGRCRCTPREVAAYAARVSGPLMDRIDMQVHVGAVTLSELSSTASEEPSCDIRQRVEQARVRQTRRYAPHPRIARRSLLNAYAPGRWLDAHGAIESGARTLLHAAVTKLGLSARAYHRVLKVGRTIADLEGDAELQAHHIAEALRYRPAAIP